MPDIMIEQSNLADIARVGNLMIICFNYINTHNTRNMFFKELYKST